MDNELSERLAGRVTDDWWERVAYGRDVAAVPSLMTKALNLKVVPDLVARPLSSEEVAAVVSYARGRGMPVVPRGGGASAFFNSVPVRGGISLDLAGLTGELALDEAAQAVSVGAGCRWGTLDAKLRRLGWAVKSYPSSAPVATLGGWFNMEGCGIGSLRYGPLAEQVTKLEVVLADGSIHELTGQTDPPLDWFAGSDGTLGIVTKLTLGIRPAPAAESHLLAAFDDTAGLTEALATLAQSTPRPYNMALHNAAYFALLRQLDVEAPDGNILSIDYEGPTEEVAAGRTQALKVVAACGGTVLPAKLGQAEWQERFYHMRVKRLGPSLLAAEDLIPVTAVNEYLRRIAALGNSLATGFYSYGTAISPGWVNMFTGFRADARQRLPYLIAMAVTGRLHGLAIDLGGRPFAVGLWNTPYLPAIYDQAELAAQRQRKQRLDPANILNPGKHYHYPALLAPALFGPATRLGSMLQRFTGREG